MSAWTDVEPVGANAPSSGIYCSMRSYKGGTFSMGIVFYSDVQAELDLEGNERYRVAIPAGETVQRIRLVPDRTGPYQIKESARGSALRISITGLVPATNEDWARTAVEWKIVERDLIEIALPHSVKRAGR